MNEDGRFLPWHAVQRTHLFEQHGSDKLPHAMLLAGPAHVGKGRFAHALAGYLLCAQPTAEGRCGDCNTCHLFSAGTHPDFRQVEPEESKLIRIEQIRDLIDWASQTSQMGGLKVALLTPAEKMNVQSANALLKCLEEPAPNTVLLLVSHQPGRLLPTVKSRCQRIDFPLPRARESLPWLESMIGDDQDAALLLRVAGGAPLAVVERMDEEYIQRRATVMAGLEHLIGGGETAMAVAGRLSSLDPDEVLEMLYGVLEDALKIGLTEDKKYLKNRDMQRIVAQIAGTSPRRELVSLIERVAAARRAVQGPSNPNGRLLLEDLLIGLAAGLNADSGKIYNL